VGLRQRVRRAVHRVNARLPRSREGVVVLTYHLVGAGTGSPVDLPREAFRDQLEELRRDAVVVSLAEAVEHLAFGEPSWGPLVVLTFDDAYRNFYAEAWPVLRELGLPATLYVPVDFVAGRAAPPIRGTEGIAACSWDELRELAAGGLVTIGSHSLSHPDLRAVRGGRLEAEVRGSKAALEEALGVTVETFCYPRGKVGPAAERLVRQTYSSAVVRGGRRMHAGQGWDPFRLERVPIRRDMGVSFREVLESPVWLEEWAAAKLDRWR